MCHHILSNVSTYIDISILLNIKMQSHFNNSLTNARYFKVKQILHKFTSEIINSLFISFKIVFSELKALL